MKNPFKKEDEIIDKIKWKLKEDMPDLGWSYIEAICDVVKKVMKNAGESQ